MRKTLPSHLNYLERATPASAVGDGRGRPGGCVQDQEDLQEANEEEGKRPPKPDNGVREARERAQTPGVLGLSPGVVDPACPVTRGSPTHSAPKLLKAEQNAVVAEEHTLGAGWGLTGRWEPPKPLARSSCSGQPGLSYKTGGPISCYLPRPLRVTVGALLAYRKLETLGFVYAGELGRPSATLPAPRSRHSLFSASASGLPRRPGASPCSTSSPMAK